MNIMNNEYMVRTLSAFVNSALNKCSLSLEHETDQRTFKTKLREVQNLFELKSIQLCLI